MIDILKKRFTENKERHLVISFEEVEKKFTPKILHSLTMMEEAGSSYEWRRISLSSDITSSWVVTPERIRCLGGAIFCERRYNEVFTFHNGDDSHYSSRGFRCIAEL